MVASLRDSMNEITLSDEILSEYPEDSKRFVYPATRENAVAMVRALEARIADLPQFESFPEGAVGVILYTLLANGAFTCPDAGDFNHFVQGCRTMLDAAQKVVERRTFRR